MNNKVYDSRDNCNALIKSIDNTLLEGCKNTKIPSSVVTIEEGAFHDCTITTINIPEGIRNIKEKAFWRCTSLKQLNFQIRWKI